MLDDFEYDVNGNMVKDRNKEIDSISYNHLNLPVSIVFDTLPQQINYVYDATGVKLEKSVTDKGTVTTEYAGNYIYNNAEDGTMKLQFLNHPEGYIVPVANTGGSVKGSFGGTTTYSGYSYVFQYKDHLGNARLSYSDSNLDGAITQSEIIEESNYYPFGLKQKGYNNTVSSNGNSLAQKFKYNGKELSDELGVNLYEYGARFYDPTINIFTSIDPRAESFSFQSPYIYAANNPVYFEEKNGEFPFPPGWKKGVRAALNYIAENTDSKVAKFAVGYVETGLEAIPDAQTDMEDSVRNTAKGLSQLKNGNYSGAADTFNLAGRGERKAISEQVKKIKSGDMRAIGGGTRMVFETVAAIVSPAKIKPKFKIRTKSKGPVGLDGNPQTMPETVFRGGGSSPSNLKKRPGETAVSFSEGLANPIEGPSVFSKSDFIKVKTSALPEGSVTLDGGLNGMPRGHVSIDASIDGIKSAVIGKGKFPKL